MQATSLQGRFTPEQGLRRMIGTNPVDFQIGSNGVITLRPRSVNVDTAKIDDVMTVRAFTVANPVTDLRTAARNQRYFTRADG